MSKIKMTVMVFLFCAAVLTVGTVNLSEIWSLIDEIVDNTSSIVGLVIMGITIAIAAYIGTFIKNLLENAAKVGKTK